MKSHPMIFQADSVRGIFAGRKTQTRRIINRLKGFGYISEFQASDTKGYDWKFRCRRGLMHDIKQSELEKCLPYAVGDRIWGKEGFCQGIGGRPFWYKSDFIQRYGAWEQDVKEGAFGTLRNETGWKSPLFMPRAASRLDLLITSLRIEQVQDISESDAIAEGIEPCQYPNIPEGFINSGKAHWFDYVERKFSIASAKSSYFSLWEVINGRKSLESNQVVLVIKFNRVECPL